MYAVISITITPPEILELMPEEVRLKFEMDRPSAIAAAFATLEAETFIGVPLTPNSDAEVAALSSRIERFYLLNYEQQIIGRRPVSIGTARHMTECSVRLSKDKARGSAQLAPAKPWVWSVAMDLETGRKFLIEPPQAHEDLE